MKNIVVTYHREDGSWWAEADGYTAAANTFKALRLLVAEGLSMHLDGQPFRIHEYLEGGAAIGSTSMRWQSFPFDAHPQPTVTEGFALEELFA